MIQARSSSASNNWLNGFAYLKNKDDNSIQCFNIQSLLICLGRVLVANMLIPNEKSHFSAFVFSNVTEFTHYPLPASNMGTEASMSKLFLYSLDFQKADILELCFLTYEPSGRQK